mmetsp:Transcript_20643/g.55721  ORF Transcript_20643/g.55721 Transcript_20643/m.55721 type:complete len:124 (-) Transcript_20643:446-817(-)
MPGSGGPAFTAHRTSRSPQWTRFTRSTPLAASTGTWPSWQWTPRPRAGATAAASRARGRIADADRLDSLLVCNGNRNKTVYERLGYIAVGDTSFVDDTQPAHSSASTPPPMYVMKRSVSGIVQ